MDTINGMLLKYQLPGGISAAYKLGLLSLLLLYIYRYATSVFLPVIILVAIFFIWSILRFYFVDNIHFIYAFQQGFKVLFFFLVIAAVSNFQSLTHIKLKLVFGSYILTLLLNVAASFLGFGDFSYGNFGAKGFFDGGNIVSGVIIVCSSFFLVGAYRTSTSKFVLSVIFFFSLSVLMGTKAAVLGVLLVTLLILSLRIDLRALILLFGSLFFVSVLVFFNIETIQNSLIVDRIIYFYNKGGLTEALLSGRDIKLDYFFWHFSNASLAEFFLGISRVDFFQYKYDMVELDFADLLLYFGALFTLVVYILISFLFFSLLKVPSGHWQHASIVSFIAMILVSSIAGHILINGVITPIWGLLLGSGLALPEGAQQKRFNYVS